MGTLAKAATGTIVTIAGTAIPELMNVSDIGLALDMAPVDSHDGVGWGAAIPTRKRGKPITLEFNWVPGNPQHVALLNAALNRTSTAFTVVHPVAGNPTWTFQAFVGEFSLPTNPGAGAMIARVILNPDGAMTFA